MKTIRFLTAAAIAMAAGACSGDVVAPDAATHGPASFNADPPPADSSTMTTQTGYLGSGN